ncbi:hypothetical protein [Pseudomonas sp. DC3200b2]|uniref:hypothetical protein n=1 Tax=Pseudomonas sp. DC3200b2 TaxID=2804669 RepID=UPI003CF3A8D9
MLIQLLMGFSHLAGIAWRVVKVFALRLLGHGRASGRFTTLGNGKALNVSAELITLWASPL